MTLSQKPEEDQGMQAIGQKKPNRTRKRRQDKGRMRWTERDSLVLGWIGEQYAIRMDQLQARLGQRTSEPTQEPGVLGIETTRKLVQRWKRAGMVEHAVLEHNQPGWAWLTRRGLEQVGLAYQTWEPKTQGLPHLFALNQVRAWVEQREREAIWHSERQLRHERVVSRTQTRAVHRPDAEVEVRGQRVAIEVELSEKLSGRLAAILYELARTYTSIWYCCPPTTEGELRRAIEQLNPPSIRQKFSIVPPRLEGQCVHRPTNSPLRAEQS